MLQSHMIQNLHASWEEYVGKLQKKAVSSTQGGDAFLESQLLGGRDTWNSYDFKTSLLCVPSSSQPGLWRESLSHKEGKELSFFVSQSKAFLEELCHCPQGSDLRIHLEDSK